MNIAETERLLNQDAVAHPVFRSGDLSPFGKNAAAFLQCGCSPLPTIGKAPVEGGWQRRAREPMTLAEIASWSARSGPFNIGLSLGYGGLVAIDRDAERRDVIDAVRPVFEAMHRRGGVAVAKAGARGATSFFFDALGNITNRNFVDADGAMLFEILGTGRQTIVPPSVHPDTGHAYHWLTSRTLLDTTPDELVPILPEDIAALEAALERFLPKRPSRNAAYPASPAPVVRGDRWLDAAVRGVCSDLASTRQGSRNATLNASAYRLGRLGLTLDDATATLAPIAIGIGLGRTEVLRTIRSGWSAGAAAPLAGRAA